MNPIDILVILVYVLGCTALGAWLGSRSRGLKGYFLGESNIPAWAVMVSIVATETSTATFLSVPGVAYGKADFTYLQLAFGYILGRIVVATVLLPSYFRGEIYTAYQVLERRFGGATRTTASLLFLVTRTLADGLRLFLAAKVLEQLTGWPIGGAIVAMGVATIVYTYLGGMKAVIWTDVIQFFVYIAGALIALAILVGKLPGGADELWTRAASAHKFRLFDFSITLTQPFTFWAGLLGGMVLNTATHGADQLMVQRYLSARSQRQAAGALIASGFVVLAQFALFLLIGVGLFVFYQDFPPTATAGAGSLAPDEVFAYFIVHYLPTGVLGVVIAAIFSAAMSTLSSSLNSSASTTVNDLYRPLFPASDERRLLRLSKVLTAFWGIVQMAVAFGATRLQDSVVNNALAIASFVTGILLGLFLLGILTRRVGQPAAFIGLIAGLAAVSTAAFATPLAWPWYALVGSFTVFVIGNLMALVLPEPDRERTPEGTMTRMIPLLVLVTLFATQAEAHAALLETSPVQVGLDPDRLAGIDGAIARAISAQQVPGAVVLVGRHGKIAYVRASGRRAVEPADEPLTRDTVFDMASLTKPLATASSIMILVERGKLRLDDTLAKLMPEFDQHGKGAITVEQLLRHRSGLIADNPLSDYDDGPEEAWKRIAGLELMNPPGERFRYSDVNFLILGKLVERLTGERLDRFARKEIFEPLGMSDTGYRPIGENADIPIERIAPTEKDRGEMLRGVVHDPRARALGGVAGHAGLFSTADDVAVFARMILDGGVGPDGRRILSPLTVRVMTTPGDTPRGQRRGLGWDIATGYSAPRGALFGTRSFGHTGFTGTSLWIDPETETFVIVLTSRLHPDGKSPSPTALRAEVATLAAAAIVDPAVMSPERTSPEQPVACGIDVLVRDGFQPLRGKRVGLVTNHTGRTRDGSSTIDVLFHAPEVKLVTLFSPEHGIRGLVDAEVADSKDEATGLPIVSLYGKSRKPTAESLEGLDVLVYDIQDIGARFYTYISTLGLVLEAAKEQCLAVVVLDRPNPIGGVAVSGPVRDDEFESFIAHHALPVRHGMTVGELARLFNDERKIGAELQVIACEGWRREDLYDRTGLLWVNPSPNMRSLTEALLYPGVGLLEATNLATGRGTDTPFERVGAPWIDPRDFARALDGLGLPGVKFVPIRFTPKERQYSGRECGGVQIMIDDWRTFEPLSLGIGMAGVLQALYPKQWEPSGLLKMIADRRTYDAIVEGRRLREVLDLCGPELEEFRKVRSRHLLYEK